MKKTKNKNYLDKLKNGDYGLAKTFWLYDTAVNLLLISFAEIILYLILSLPDSSFFLWFLLIFIVLVPFSIRHIIFSSIGVWRAANNYQGLKLWSILAQIRIIINIIAIIILLAWLMLLVFEYYKLPVYFILPLMTIIITTGGITLYSLFNKKEI